MINTIPSNIFRFFAVIIFQVLILNHTSLTPLNISPFVFILFILLLPFETPNWLLLILAFLLGLSLDIFADELGKFSFSLVLIAFIRPLVLNLLSTREGYRKKTSPSIKDYGIKWFLKYSIILVFIHNISFYFLETFQLKYLLVILLKIILNTIFTTLLLIILQSFANNKRNR